MKNKNSDRRHKRVKVGAKCKKSAHYDCTVAECECSCHAEER